MSKYILGTTGVLAAFFFARTSQATTLTGNVSLSVDSPVLTANPDSVTPIGNVYSWADKNGDGTADDPVDAGLNLATYNLTRQTETNGFVLDLNDGTADGAITWGGVSGGKITTDRDSMLNNNGPITIRGATDISCEGLYTHRASRSQAGHVTITQSGSFSAANIWTWQYYGGEGSSGDIVCKGGGPEAGSFTVTGLIESAGRSAGSGAIDISGYSGVTVGSGGIKSYNAGPQDGQTLSITNIGAGGISVDGDILHYTRGANNASHTKPNHVVLQTLGNVDLAGGVATYQFRSTEWMYTDTGTITITAGGSVAVAGAMKTYAVANFDAQSRNSGNVNITAGGDVQLASIDTHHVRNQSNRYAGDVKVNAGGGVTINATEIDLSSPYGGSNQGNMWLIASDGCKSITFGDESKPGTNVLDLAKLEYIRFDSASGKSYIHNTINNFVAGAPNTKLRVERDGEIVYYAVKDGANAALLDEGNGVYQIQSVAGGTGYLKPITARGTVIRIK